MPKKIIVPGFNDLWTTHPNIAKELARPDQGYRIHKGTRQKVEWLCDKGHTFWAVPQNRARLGTGCTFCSGQRVLVGFNDLATTMPQLALELLRPDDGKLVMRASSKPMDWVCASGHTYSARVDHRSSRGIGCPVCAGKEILVGFNDLGTTAPDLASELLHASDAHLVTRMSTKKVEWLCGEGHTYSARVHNRSRGTGCPVCSGRQILVGFNDLCSTDPQLAAELRDRQEGLTVTKFSSRKCEWVCSLGHVFWNTVAHRSSGRGCPSCALNHTSKVESFLRDTLRTWFKDISPDHTDRARTRSGKSRSVDMMWKYGGTTFICEYDGAYWHSGREAKDIEKTLLLLDSGYAVIRVRESSDSSRRVSLPTLGLEHPRLLQICAPYQLGHANLLDVADEIRRWAGQVSPACLVDTVSDSI